MKIISGKFKGLKIPFINEKFDNAVTTPQKVKEALFSILGESISGKKFLDLYACSGQIGMEALSHGAEIVVFNESDNKRYNFIKSQIEKWKLEESTILLRYHSFRALRYLETRSYKFDFIFIDPPYVKKKDNIRNYYKILNELGKRPVLAENGLIIIQHYADNIFENEIGEFYLHNTRKYAKNSLTFFKRITNAL